MRIGATNWRKLRRQLDAIEREIESLEVEGGGSFQVGPGACGFQHGGSSQEGRSDCRVR
jgi:hypothetical protein